MVLSSPINLSEKDIESLESLGVNFVDRSSLGLSNSPLSGPSSNRLSRSGSSSSTHVTRSTNRNSLGSAKRRRSLKIPLGAPNIPSIESLASTAAASGFVIGFGSPRILPPPTGIKPTPVNPDELVHLLHRANQAPEHEPRPLLVIDLRSLHHYLGHEGRLIGSM